LFCVSSRHKILSSRNLVYYIGYPKFHKTGVSSFEYYIMKEMSGKYEYQICLYTTQYFSAH
jgi:hypothetical protein